MWLRWAILPLLCLADEDGSGLLQGEQLLKKFSAELDCKSGKCHPKTTTPPIVPVLPPVLPPLKPVTTPAPLKVTPIVPVTTMPTTTPTTTSTTKPKPRFNCMTRELWSKKKKRWCCKRRNLGCKKKPVTTVKPPRLPPSQFNVVPDGCKGFKKVKEDCTNKDLFILKKNTKGFVAPTFKPDQYGSDALWATEKVQDSDWKGTCVAYVATGGGTCKTFCESNGMKCVRAMDDAHHQTAGLSKWLKTGGYKPTDCTLLPSGHSRQSQKENGCNQKWGTQMCTCANLVTTMPVKPIAQPVVKPIPEPIVTSRCRWSGMHKDKYIGGCSQKCARFKELAQAKVACAAEKTCGGVTLEHGKWELRSGPRLAQTPKGKGENSYVCDSQPWHPR